MKIQFVKEVCLYCNDLSTTREFYENILGFSVISEVANRHIFFRVGKMVLLCFNPEVTKDEQILPPHFAYGPQHIAFEVQLKDYDNWKRKLKEKEVKIIHEQHWKADLFSIYFNDPAGNILEIVPPGIWE